MIEVWKDIELNPKYKISNLGRIYSKFSEKIIRQQNRGRYSSVSLGGVRVAVHRLVAIAFVPNPCNKATVNHIDGNKYNNKFSNLEWNTQKENIQHAWREGLASTKYGENKHTSVLDDMHILTIATLKDLYSREKLAKYLPNRGGREVSLKSKKEQIRRIIKGERWAHLNHLFNP